MTLFQQDLVDQIALERAFRRARRGAAVARLVTPGNGRSTTKTLPTPGRLVTETSPPMATHSLRAMPSPRPVPPTRRVAEESACTNGSKTDPIRSGAMPTPVSRTRSGGLAALAVNASIAISPASVNFTALDTKL